MKGLKEALDCNKGECPVCNVLKKERANIEERIGTNSDGTPLFRPCENSDLLADFLKDPNDPNLFLHCQPTRHSIDRKVRT